MIKLMRRKLEEAMASSSSSRASWPMHRKNRGRRIPGLLFFLVTALAWNDVHLDTLSPEQRKSNQVTAKGDSRVPGPRLSSNNSRPLLLFPSPASFLLLSFSFPFPPSLCSPCISCRRVQSNLLWRSRLKVSTQTQ